MFINATAIETTDLKEDIRGTNVGEVLGPARLLYSEAYRILSTQHMTNLMKGHIPRT